MNRLVGPAATDSRSLESEIIRLRGRLNRAEARISELEERFHGYVYTESSAIVDIISTAGWVDLPYTGTLDATSVGLESVSGKLGLKSSASKPYLVRVQATFDAHSLGPNEEMALRLVLNGTKIDGAECHATGTANGVIAKLHSYAHLWMSPGDEITMQAANFTNNGDLSFERGKMDIVRLPGAD